MHITRILLFIFVTSSILAQRKSNAFNKGSIYFYWGWNRTSYAESDIRFHGSNYDFTIHDVKAHDRPKGVHIDYINPTRITIPQTNFRLGYFFSDKYNISLGLDHMKYVMTQNQTVNISGKIEVPGFEYHETTDANTKQLTDDFLMFEHTDGLNYINVELTRLDDLTPYLFSSLNTDDFQINVLNGIGLGMLYPRTNTTLMNKERYDEFHVAGYGASLKTGLNFTFFKHFFIQSEIKEGYINMPDIRTSINPTDRASQHFFFFQRNITLGGIFRI